MVLRHALIPRKGLGNQQQQQHKMVGQQSQYSQKHEFCSIYIMSHHGSFAVYYAIKVRRCSQRTWCRKNHFRGFAPSLDLSLPPNNLFL